MYNKTFWLLCLSSFTFLGSFNMIIPELPSYLTSLGGAEYKGLIISLFTLSAGIARPYSGKWADLLGRRPIMLVGTVVCIVLGFLYPLFTTIWGFFLLRFLHGFSAGFKPTGTTAYLSDIVPTERRGEALGILGVSGSLGMASGPAIGSFIAAEFGLNTMFYASSLMAFVSYLTVANVKESLPNPKPFELSMFKLKRDDIFEKKVIIPSFIMVFYSFSFGTLLTISPDYSDLLGIPNRGYIFTVILLMSMLTRFFSGKASDRYGRYKVLLAGAIALVLGLGTIGLSNTAFWFLAGGGLFGIANGIISPTVFALTADLADDAKRGRAFGTIFIMLELGVGMGALVSAALYDNVDTQFGRAYMAASLLGFISLGIIIYQLVKPKFERG